MFAYGIENDKNGLATLLGKVLPVYYPNLLFREDGCLVLPIGETFAIISGDGSGINERLETEVAFEIKCPIPGKTFSTDQYYNFPVYYTTQVMSQMVSKQMSLLPQYMLHTNKFNNLQRNS